MASGLFNSDESAADVRSTIERHVALETKAGLQNSILDAKMRFWSQRRCSKLQCSTQKCDSGLKGGFQNCIFFDGKMRFWPRKPSSESHFSTKKCGSLLKIISSELHFSTIAFFDAKMWCCQWPAKVSSMLVSTQKCVEKSLRSKTYFPFENES